MSIIIRRLNQLKEIVPETSIALDIRKRFFEENAVKLLSRKKSISLFRKTEPRFIETLAIYALNNSESHELLYCFQKMNWNKFKLLQIFGLDKTLKFSDCTSIFKLTLFLNLTTIKLHVFPDATKLKYLVKICNSESIVFVYDKRFSSCVNSFNKIFFGVRREDAKNPKMRLHFTHNKISSRRRDRHNIFEKKIAQATINILSLIPRDICSIVTLNFDFIRYVKIPALVRKNFEIFRFTLKLALTNLVSGRITNVSKRKRFGEATLTKVYTILTGAFSS